MMMPGAIAAFTVALRIPEGWSGKKTFWLRVKKVTSTANWVGAMANAAGVLADPGQPTANAAATDELCWTLDDSGERLVLEQSGAKSNAAASGLFANDMLDVSTDIAVLNAMLQRDGLEGEVLTSPGGEF